MWNTSGSFFPSAGDEEPTGELTIQSLEDVGEGYTSARRAVQTARASVKDMLAWHCLWRIPDNL